MRCSTECEVLAQHVESRLLAERSDALVTFDAESWPLWPADTGLDAGYLHRWWTHAKAFVIVVVLRAGQVAALVGANVADARICNLKEGITDYAGAFFAHCLHTVLLRRLIPSDATTQQHTAAAASAATSATATATDPSAAACDHGRVVKTTAPAQGGRLLPETGAVCMEGAVPVRSDERFRIPDVLHSGAGCVDGDKVSMQPWV